MSDDAFDSFVFCLFIAAIAWCSFEIIIGVWIWGMQ